MGINTERTTEKTTERSRDSMPGIPAGTNKSRDSMSSTPPVNIVNKKSQGMQANHRSSFSDFFRTEYKKGDDLRLSTKLHHL